MVNDGIISRIGERLTKAGGGLTATGIIEKLSTSTGLSHQSGYGDNVPEPPYERYFSPLWIYQIRRNQPLMATAIQKKTKQTYQNGLTEWEKAYDAKCPRCEEEFQGLDAFRKQMGEAGEDLSEEEIDLDSERVCPECEAVVEMMEPDERVRNRAQEYLDRINQPEDEESHVQLEPTEHSSISQSVIDLLWELSLDMQSFDDAWMIFERDYVLDADGRIIDWEFTEAKRGPPELMRYVVDQETSKAGGRWYVCVKCRAEDDGYRAQEDPGGCDECGRHTYEAFAFAKNEFMGEPAEWFIRGEFAHDNEFERRRWYGYPPVLALWEESRTLEQMDRWYNDAYEERRAPRGALLVNAAHDEELRQLNRQQMDEMREDPNYIPLFMNDSQEEGDPIKFVELLQDPASMQHMEMREWFLDRISAFYGVTAILMSGSPEDSGLSQSMEVKVSQKESDQHREIMNSTFVEAILAQIGVEGWEISVAPVEVEDEREQAELVGQNLNNAQKALEMDLEVEWTPDDRAEIKPGEMAPPENEEGFGSLEGIGGMTGGIPDQEGPDPNSMPPGESPNEPHVDEPGERATDPDDPDTVSLSVSEPGGDRLEKIAAKSFDLEGVTA